MQDSSLTLPSSIPILVVGAGQAGLSVGYHLVKQGLQPGRDFLVVDRGPTAGGAWQYRWPTLRFGDAHALADLPGMTDAGVTFSGAPTHPPASDVVRERYATYEEHFGLDVHRPVNVEEVRTDGDSYVATHTAHGERHRINATVVIAAVGTWGAPRQPAQWRDSTFAGAQFTTPEYPGPDYFRGLNVAVVGAGASALGFLRELADVAKSLHWYTRHPVAFLDRDTFLREELGRKAVALQDQAAQAGRPLPSIVSTTGMPLTPPLRRLKERGHLTRTPMFTALVSDGAVQQDGTFQALDAVMWAMGFDAELALLKPLGISATRGVRVINGHTPSVPGIFLAGYGPQASTISANRGARVIARDAVRYLSDHEWPPPRR